MKIKIEVDDRNLDLARDMTQEIIYDFLARYPQAEASFASRDSKNSCIIKI